jgi:hypothetical protein
VRGIEKDKNKKNLDKKYLKNGLYVHVPYKTVMVISVFNASFLGRLPRV